MNLTVEAALNHFLARHKLDRRAYRDQGFPVKVGPFVISFPNPGKLALHDLHHVVLGVAPDFWGEVEVSIFELRSKTPTLLITILCIGAIVLGFLLSPKWVYQKWQRYRNCKNLYNNPLTYSELLSMNLSQLQQRLNIGFCECSMHNQID